MNGVIAMANAAITKLKEGEREKRREIILLAAEKLFSKRGIAEVNMRDIAREAGVSVGFIYRYFSGQADIFLELFESGAAETHKRINAAAKGADSRPLRDIARTYINYLHENMMFYQMMIYFMMEGELSDESLERLNSSLRRIVDGVENIFRHKGGVENTRVLAHSFFAALNGIMISLVNYPGRTPGEVKKRTLVLARTIADQFERNSNQ
jgi:AcrR family transcriptional regulator